MSLTTSDTTAYVDITVTGTTPEVTTPRLPGIIPDHVQYYIDIIMSIVFLSCMGLFGVTTNIINIVVFVRQGVNDCVSVCLLSLAISDFGGSLMAIVYGLGNAIVMSGTYFYMDPAVILYFSTWILSFCGEITMVITAFISVERSLCVLMPFHFKDLITFKRALCITLALYALVIGSFMPVFVTMGTYTGLDERYNETRILLWFSADRKEIELLLNFYQNTVGSILSQTVVIASTVGMVVGLQRSSKFQSQKTSSTSTNTETVMARKNKSVIKMVSYLAAIFIVCNFFRLSMILVRRIEPQVDFQLRYHNTYQTCAAIFFSAAVVNSSVNIFVYCRFKPNFLSVLLSTFGCSSGQHQEK